LHPAIFGKYNPKSII